MFEKLTERSKAKYHQNTYKHFPAPERFVYTSRYYLLFLYSVTAAQMKPKQPSCCQFLSVWDQESDTCDRIFVTFLDSISLLLVTEGSGYTSIWVCECVGEEHNTCAEKVGCQTFRKERTKYDGLHWREHLQYVILNKERVDRCLIKVPFEIFTWGIICYSAGWRLCLQLK